MNNFKQEKDVLIIGCGAAGLAAGIAASKQHARVTILEQNDRPGKKLLASGNGKCNLSHTPLDASRYHSDRPDLVEHVLQTFSPEKTQVWFREMGLLLFDRQGWIYPTTEQASSVLDVLLLEAKHLGITYKCREEVLSLLPNAEDGWHIKTKTWTYRADAVILACGSPASSVQGASDTALRLADVLGIPRHVFLPVLTPLRFRQGFSGKWQGIRIHSTASLYADQSLLATETGEVQLTAYGLSGIPILQLSRLAVPAWDSGKEIWIVLDFLPEQDADALEELWRNRLILGPYKTYAELLSGILPENLISVFLGQIGLRGDTLPSLEDQQPGGVTEKVLSHLKAFPVPIAGPAGMGQAQVCAGGISLAALQDDLSVKKYPNLYAVGEAVNVDGPCGGYNLQWAWSSGQVAGDSAAKWE